MTSFFFLLDPKGRALAYPNRDLLILSSLELADVPLLPGFRAEKCETGTPGLNRRATRRLNRLLKRDGLVGSSERAHRNATAANTADPAAYARALVEALAAA